MCSNNQLIPRATYLSMSYKDRMSLPKLKSCLWQERESENKILNL